LNLRLAIELKRPPEGLSKAHWLIGAHALASGDFELAEKEFQLAQDVLAKTHAATKEMELCNAGYLAVARLGRNPSDAVAQSSLEQIMAHFQTQTTDNAADYLKQLTTARRLFVPSTT
jgi:hypothetical protein